MRTELLYNPRLLVERLAEISQTRRRTAKLRGTLASQLTVGHVDSLELLELLRPEPPRVIFDIGANIGTWTLLAKSIFPEATVHAFEPLELHCKSFRDFTMGVPDVSLHQVALGSATATLQMQMTNRTDASSLLPITAQCGKHYGLHNETPVSVAVERLDDLLWNNVVPAPDLLKLDIQGYELEALRGGPKTLDAARAILIEVSFVELYKGQCLFHDVVQLLAENGFHLHALGRRTELGVPILQADALFLKKQ